MYRIAFEGLIFLHIISFRFLCDATGNILAHKHIFFNCDKTPAEDNTFLDVNLSFFASYVIIAMTNLL
jgi:hypothetical protein